MRTIDYKSFEKDVDAASLINGTQIQLPTYSGAILDKYSKEGEAVIDDYGYVQVGLKASDKGEPLTCVPKLSGYDEAAMNIAIDYSKHIIKESVDQITSGKADALTAEPKLKLCNYCSYKGYCGNDPASPKYRKQPDLGSTGKYGKMVSDCEKFAEPTKTGKSRKDPGYDEVTKKIGADKSMKKSDKSDRPDSLTAQRDADYISKRMNCERIVREEAMKKGIIMDIPSPHYMVVEHSPWLSTWFEDPGVIKIPIEEFDTRKMSFTYGDSMPTFSPRIKDGKEYRKKVYTYEEILDIIDRYGLPQDWNDDGAHGPERYIEVQVWCDEPIKRYM